MTDLIETRDDGPEPDPSGGDSADAVTDLAGSSDAGPDEPNGLWAGPADDPDRFELLGPGLAGGEGTTFKARYHGDGGTPLPVAVKRLSRPVGASVSWPSRTDWDRWRDQVHVIQQCEALIWCRSARSSRVRTCTIGEPRASRRTGRPTAFRTS